jgi:hypothetical protein
VGSRHRWWVVVMGPRRREWGVVVCGGGRTSPLMGGGDEPSSPLVGSGDGSAVVVDPRLLRCPSPFPPTFRRVIVVWCCRCAVSSLRAVFVVPLRRRTPSPSLSVVKEKTTRNDDIESSFLVWLPRRRRRRRGTWF